MLENRICVFCGGHTGNNKLFISNTKALGEGIVKRKWKAVYGGGSSGLMGVFANTIINNNGYIKGIIPKYLKDKELAHPFLTEISVVENILERKSKMIEESDFFIALPGGIGTLDEIFEVLILKNLDIINKPIILINIENFWSPFQILFEKLKNDQFFFKKISSLVYFTENSDKALKLIDNISKN